MPVTVKLVFADAQTAFANANLPLQLLANGEVISETLLSRDGVAIFPIGSVNEPMAIRVGSKVVDEIKDAISAGQTGPLNGVLPNQTISFQTNATITINLSDLRMLQSLPKISI